MHAAERQLWADGCTNVAGIDEAGRGPLAGPVVAAAVVMPRGVWVEGVDDSKKLSPARREELFGRIMTSATAIGIGVIYHDVIDRINILNATIQAMEDAVGSLSIVPDHILVDGNRGLRTSIPCSAIIDGDATCSVIAAASIIAKVTRDRMMLEFDRQYPGYGFAQHKGYGTLQHRTAIARLGLSPIHRRTFTVKFPAAVEL